MLKPRREGVNGPCRAGRRFCAALPGCDSRNLTFSPKEHESREVGVVESSVNPLPSMKKTMTVLTAVCAMALLPFANANAHNGSTCRIVGYTPCGKAIYAYYHVHGYDSCGRPMGHWVQQYPTSCHCHEEHGHGHGHGHDHGSGHHHDHGHMHIKKGGLNFFFKL
jgi:hypothetical protein